MISYLLFSSSVLSDSLRPYGLQYTRLPFPSLSPRVCSSSCPLSQWCHQPSHPLLPPSPPALVRRGKDPSIRVFSQWVGSRLRWPKYWKFNFSISPSSEYSGLISLGLTGWISLLSMGLSRVCSSTTVWKHQFSGALPFLWSNPQFIHDYWENP